MKKFSPILCLLISFLPCTTAAGAQEALDESFADKFMQTRKQFVDEPIYRLVNGEIERIKLSNVDHAALHIGSTMFNPKAMTAMCIRLRNGNFVRAEKSVRRRSKRKIGVTIEFKHAYASLKCDNGGYITNVLQTALMNHYRSAEAVFDMIDYFEKQEKKYAALFGHSILCKYNNKSAIDIAEENFVTVSINYRDDKGYKQALDDVKRIRDKLQKFVKKFGAWAQHKDPNLQNPTFKLAEGCPS